VSERCPYTVRTVPAMVMDENDPEDLDSDSDDHAMDEMRYFVMSRPDPTITALSQAPKPGTVGALRAEIQKRQLREVWNAGW
jgi:hypothetical protein